MHRALGKANFVGDGGGAQRLPGQTQTLDDFKGPVDELDVVCHRRSPPWFDFSQASVRETDWEPVCQQTVFSDENIIQEEGEG